MSSTSNSSGRNQPVLLQGLTTREQIADVLHRACLALDANDAALWRSAWAAADPTIAFVINGATHTGFDAIDAACFQRTCWLDTQHHNGGVRIDVREGDDTARLTATAVNQHFRLGQGMAPGAANLIAGSRYDIDVVRDAGGQWRMHTWRIESSWAQGDWAVLTVDTSS